MGVGRSRLDAAGFDRPAAALGTLDGFRRGPRRLCPLWWLRFRWQQPLRRRYVGVGWKRLVATLFEWPLAAKADGHELRRVARTHGPFRRLLFQCKSHVFRRHLGMGWQRLGTAGRDRTLAAIWTRHGV